MNIEEGNDLNNDEICVTNYINNDNSEKILIKIDYSSEEYSVQRIINFN